MTRTWYTRPVLALFVFLAITTLCIPACMNLRLGESADSRYAVYSIRFEYFGIDAAVLERMITIPLEEKLSGLNDLLEIRSVSEYGSSITTVCFSRDIDRKTTYLELQNAVDTLYKTLPQAVQKPRIYSASSEQKPVLSFAVVTDGDLRTMREYIDTDIKKKLEAVDGVAEVVVSGGTVDEIRVEFDPERLVHGSLNPEAFGTIIQDANVVSPGASLRTRTFTVPIVFDTKIASIDEIRKLPVKLDEEYTSIEYLASIFSAPRENDEIVRVNGEECIAVSVKASSSGNSIAISKGCNAVIAASEVLQGQCRVLYDTGAYLLSLIQNVLFAVLQSFICIVLLIPFFYRSGRTTLLLVLLLPVNTVWTLAILSLFGYTINPNILSGISIALGLVSDAALIVSGLAEKRSTRLAFIRDVKYVMRSIVSSGATTVLVLIPLYFLDYIVPGIRSIAVTIGIMVCNSVLLSCCFFPCFVFSEKTPRHIFPDAVYRFVERLYQRASYRAVNHSLRFRGVYAGLYIALMIVPLVLFALTGKNITLDGGQDVLFAVIEYEPEKKAKIIDEQTGVFCASVAALHGVDFVRTEVRKGAMDIDVGFNAKKTTPEELSQRILGLGPMVTDGFLYLPVTDSQTGAGLQEIQIAVLGDESTECRVLARKAVEALSYHPDTVQTVLNFKNPEETVLFKPDRDVLAKNSIGVSDIADTLRWMLFGPVVDKWIQNGNETDIRVVGAGMKDVNMQRIADLHVPTEAGGVRLNTLGSLYKTEGTGKLYRQDNRRTAYFTATMKSGSTEAAIESIYDALSTVETPKGYGFALPYELNILAEQYRTLFFAFLLSIVGILLLLTALSENFVISLFVTSIIPVSAALPVIIRFCMRTPLEMGDIIGLVVLSGITVNNAIYITESGKSGIRYKVREKIQSILVTSFTTIAGAIPLMLVKSSGFSGDLAFFMIWGTLGSVITVLLLFPAVSVCGKRILSRLGRKRTNDTAAARSNPSSHVY